MTLQIQSNGFRLDPALRESIRQRLSFAFGRIQPSVDRIQVHLSDRGSRYGGPGKEVRLEVGLRGAPKVVVAHRDATWKTALSHATERAWRSVRDQVVGDADRSAPRLAAGLPCPRPVTPERDREELLGGWS